MFFVKALTIIILPDNGKLYRFEVLIKQQKEKEKG